MKSDSIFKSCLRSFLVTISIMVGIGVGFIPLILGIGTAASSGAGSAELQYGYSHEVLPNVKGERKLLSSDSPVILNIDIEGVIGLEFLNRHTIEKQLTESLEGALKGRVKGIILRINSPGGTVIDSAEIMTHLNHYKDNHNIPIYAHVDGLCASGAMYVALSADKIYANEVSLIGNVGVISPPYFNFSNALEKMGIESLTIFEGKGKDDMNMFRPWKPGESDSFKSIIEYFYSHFVDSVVKSRPLITRDELVNTLGAQIFSVDDALKYGYIDGKSTTYAETLQLLVDKVGIEDDSYQVIGLESRNWLSQLIRGEHPLISGKMEHRIANLPVDMHPDLHGQFLYLYSP